MLISDSHKFVFVHLPKTGGDSITAALRPYAIDGGVGQAVGSPKHWTAQRIRTEYFQRRQDRSWAEYFRFGVVRNPWQQVHSDYWFCRNSSVPGHELGSWRDKVIRSKEVSFSQFVVDICGEHGCAGCGNYQHYLTIDHRQAVTQILRYESLAEDFRQVCETFGLPTIELPRKNVTPRKTDFREDYDGRSRFLVGRRFADDIERFNYTFEGA